VIDKPDRVFASIMAEVNQTENLYIRIKYSTETPNPYIEIGSIIGITTSESGSLSKSDDEPCDKKDDKAEQDDIHQVLMITFFRQCF